MCTCLKGARCGTILDSRTLSYRYFGIAERRLRLRRQGDLLRNINAGAHVCKLERSLGHDTHVWVRVLGAHTTHAASPLPTCRVYTAPVQRSVWAPTRAGPVGCGSRGIGAGRTVPRVSRSPVPLFAPFTCTISQVFRDAIQKIGEGSTCFRRCFAHPLGVKTSLGTHRRRC
jgi:hypothetical protein